MKYNITSINKYSNGAIRIDYRKLDDNGNYLGSVSNDSNLPIEVTEEIYKCIHNIETLLNENSKERMSTDPCDYCTNSNGTTCPIRACMEYSRWNNNGLAPKEVIVKVEDFHYDRW